MLCLKYVTQARQCLQHNKSIEKRRGENQFLSTDAVSVASDDDTNGEHPRVQTKNKTGARIEEF